MKDHRIRTILLLGEKKISSVSAKNASAARVVNTKTLKKSPISVIFQTQFFMIYKTLKINDLNEHKFIKAHS